MDYNDEEQIAYYAEKTVDLAEEYRMSRQSYAESRLKIDKALAEAYSNDEIKEGIAYDKALLKLIEQKPELKSEYEDMLQEQQNYKGLEKVLDARRHFVSLQQSMIKNRIQERV